MTDQTPISRSQDALQHTDDGSHLESGQLSKRALVSLSLASFFPAVSIALVPFLVFSTAGVMAWQSSLLATVAIVCIGRAVVEFARRYVATGSLYSYIGEVFGPWSRYLTGAALLGGFIVAIGSLTSVTGIFVGSFLYSRGLDNAMNAGPQIIVFACALLFAVAIAFRGLDTSVSIAVALAVLALPLVVIITISSARHTGLDLGEQFSTSGFDIGHTLQGIAVGAAFLIAFESCAALASETRDPRRNVPTAVMAVPVILGGIFPIVTVLQVPGLAAASDQLAAGVSAPAALAVQAGLGTWVATASDLVLALASLASLIGFVNYGARFALTLAEDGLLPASITRVHPRHHSPVVAIAAMAVAGFVLMSGLITWTGDIVSAYAPTATLLVYLWVLPYLLIAAGAIVLTVRARQFRPGLWLAATVGALAMAWTYVNGFLNPAPSPTDSMVWVTILVIVVLLAVFAVNKRSRVGRTAAHEVR
ncbi:APC family permease [Nocardia asteroides]|uniref:APC family permease n=1 Tax=Nocardia asteroides TaxID=1824 RepID=UPI0037C6175E